MDSTQNKREIVWNTLQGGELAALMKVIGGAARRLMAQSFSRSRSDWHGS